MSKMLGFLVLCVGIGISLSTKLDYISLALTITAEEGTGANIPCDGFLPHARDDVEVKFIWYKEGLRKTQDPNRTVAIYDKKSGNLTTLNDLSERALVHHVKGSLIINKTVVTDDHFYTCFFTGFLTGLDFKKEAKLQITVSPKSSQLMFYTLGQLLTEGSSQDLVCKVDRVRPLPKEFYIRFTDNDTRLGVQSELKNDNLTYSLSVKYSLVTTASHQNKQLVCEYVLPTGVILQSALVTLPIFGSQSKNWVVIGVTLSVLFLIVLCISVGLAVLCFKRKEKQDPSLNGIISVNVGVGFAWNYFYGYIKNLGIEWRIHHSMNYKQHQSKMLSQFVIILPPKRMKNYQQITAQFAETDNNKLDKGICKMRSGKERWYYLYTHAVQTAEGKEYIFCGDFPLILFTLVNMGLDFSDLGRQVLLFKEELQDLIDLHLHDQAVIVEYSDDSERFAQNIEKYMAKRFTASPTLELQSNKLDGSTLRNVASGLAWVYYHNYLAIIGPEIFQHLEKAKKEYVKLESKFFILIPRSCECKDLSKESSINLIHKLQDLEVDTSGRKRFYKFTVYTVHDKYLCMEYCGPLDTIYDMATDEETECSDLFYKTLLNIFQEHDVKNIRNGFEFVHYDDMGIDEGKKLSDIIIEAIYKTESLSKLLSHSVGDLIK